MESQEVKKTPNLNGIRSKCYVSIDKRYTVTMDRFATTWNATRRWIKTPLTDLSLTRSRASRPYCIHTTGPDQVWSMRRLASGHCLLQVYVSHTYANHIVRTLVRISDEGNNRKLFLQSTHLV